MQNPNRKTLRGRPTCPTILVPFQQRLYALPLHRLDVEIEIHVSTAFVKITGEWRNIAKFKTDCLLCLPIKGTVTDAKIELGDRKLATLIVPRNRLESMGVQQKQKVDEEKQKKQSTSEEKEPLEGKLPETEYQEYLPDLFRLPIHGVEPNTMVRATVTYVENLDFQKGMFLLQVPMKLSSKIIAPGKTFNDVFSLRCTVNNTTPFEIEHRSSHPLQMLPAEDPRIEFQVTSFEIPSPQAGAASASTPDGETAKETKHPNFGFAYKISTSEIHANLLNEPTPANPEFNQPEGGNFVLFVTPPSLDQVTKTLPRRVIFLLDRSGSMHGRPFQEAKEALLASLEQLGPQDTFSICAFDDRQVCFNRGRLTAATPKQIRAAGKWITTVPPENGATDISTPLLAALDLLEQPLPEDPRRARKKEKKPPKGTFAFLPEKKSPSARLLPPVPVQSDVNDESKLLEVDTDLTLPIVVLLTDGCVQGEATLCGEVDKRVKQTRILTFGIGSYCNWYFLKMLAQIGRGFSDTCVYSVLIAKQITELFTRVRIPILTGIRLVLPRPSSSAAVLPNSPPDRVQVEGKERKEEEDGTAGVTSHEIYPHPIPDLFLGNPLTISGRYHGILPEEIELRGRLVGGGQHRIRIQVRTSAVVPAGRIFLQQRLELLTAKAWMQENFRLREEVIAESCNQRMPTPFTAMVAYETTDEKEAALEEARKTRTHGKNAWYRDKMTLGMTTAAGGAVVVGAMAYSFGDLAASVGNVPVLGPEHFMVGEIDCCDCGACELAGAFCAVC